MNRVFKLCLPIILLILTSCATSGLSRQERTAIVQLAYQDILQREVSASELDTWSETLTNETPISVRRAIASDDEAHGMRDDLYRELVCRDSTALEHTADVGALAGGMSLESIRSRIITSSSEYSDRGELSCVELAERERERAAELARIEAERIRIEEERRRAAELARQEAERIARERALAAAREEQRQMEAGEIPSAVVPNLVGLSRVDAESTIRDLGLRVGTVEDAYERNIRDRDIDFVRTQSGSVGTRVPLDDARSRDVIDLSVSARGSWMPDILNMTADQADRILAEENLRPRVLEDVYSAQVSAGRIVNQNPTPDTQLEPGDVVEYQISKGIQAPPTPISRGQLSPRFQLGGLSGGAPIYSIDLEYEPTPLPGGAVYSIEVMNDQTGEPFEFPSNSNSAANFQLPLRYLYQSSRWIWRVQASWNDPATGQRVLGDWSETETFFIGPQLQPSQTFLQ